VLDFFTGSRTNEALIDALQCGERALSNSIWLAASEHHEMPLYIQNYWASGIRNAWALDEKDDNPTLLGSTQLLALQKFVHTRLSKNQAMHGLEDAGKAARAVAQEATSSSPVWRSKAAKVQRKLEVSLPALAGGLRVAEDVSPKKKQRNPLPSKAPPSSSTMTRLRLGKGEILPVPTHGTPPKVQTVSGPNAGPAVVSDKAKISEDSPTQATQKAAEFLPASAKILSTASSKLSYLITQVLKYQKSEKIIIFYETDNVAYYIAQLLEAINVEHLIYAKSLSSDRRSRYIVTFNQSPQFRVLLMDISQAAFGLDVSAASRVYFVNPVFNKQIEAQAVKRAHRIGQFRPVYVETLVLRDSIEEVIIERRKVMSSDEQQKCKTVLDDETMYDWIKNVRFVSIPQDDLPGPGQMAHLEKPQPVFSHGKPANAAMHDPDAGLVHDFSSPTLSKGKGKDKRKASTSQEVTTANIDHDMELNTVIVVRTPTPPRKRQKSVAFLVQDDGEHANPTPSPQNNRTPHPSGGPSSPTGYESSNSLSPGNREQSPTTKADRSHVQSARDLLLKLGLNAKRRGGSPGSGSGTGLGSVPGAGNGASSGSGSGSAVV
jgi:hypothetical protein